MVNYNNNIYNILLAFRKTDEFFDIVRSIVLAQLVISSQSVVFILFIIILVRENIDTGGL